MHLYLAAKIHELVTASPYLGSPLGALRSPAQPQRGREADLARDGSSTILRAAVRNALTRLKHESIRKGTGGMCSERATCTA